MPATTSIIMLNYQNYDTIVKIDAEIKKGRYPNYSDFAKILAKKISKRTLGRYIEHMRIDLKLDLRYDKYKKGYYYADKGLKEGSLLVSQKDMFSFYVVEKVLEQYKGTPLHDTLRHSLEKLKSSLPKDMTIPFDAINERVIVRSTGTVNMLPEMWQKLFDAVLFEKRCIITHNNPNKKDKSSERRIDPCALVYQNDSWYLLARDVASEEMRTFGLWRILHIEVTDDYFDPPDLKDIPAMLDKAFGMDAGSTNISVHLRVSKEYAKFVSERQWFPGQSIKFLPSGEMDMTYKTTGWNSNLKLILGWGSHVKVLAPASLRDTVKQILKDALEQY